jgi:hypothetical protein
VDEQAVDDGAQARAAIDDHRAIRGFVDQEMHPRELEWSAVGQAEIDVVGRRRLVVDGRPADAEGKLAHQHAMRRHLRRQLGRIRQDA